MDVYRCRGEGLKRCFIYRPVDAHDITNIDKFVAHCDVLGVVSHTRQWQPHVSHQGAEVYVLPRLTVRQRSTPHCVHKTYLT